MLGAGGSRAAGEQLPVLVLSITAGTPEHADEGDWQTATSTAISKEITGLTNGSVYIAQIRAVNAKGHSDYNNWQQATPTAGATAPTC